MSFTLGITLALSAVLGGSSQAALTPTALPQAQTVKEYVQTYFADAPIMAAIAECESHFTQLDKDGTVVKNPHSSAVGVFQIMASIHAASADENLGLNIYTLQGNAAYARYLYESQGTAPWNDSKACWGKTAAAKKSAATSTVLAMAR
jgi:hypothetical protein